MQKNVLLLYNTISILGLLSHYNDFMNNRDTRTNVLSLFATVERKLSEWYTTTNP